MRQLEVEGNRSTDHHRHTRQIDRRHCRQWLRRGRRHHRSHSRRPQAWLARGALAPSLEPRDWVERRLIEIPSPIFDRSKSSNREERPSAVRDPRMLPAFGWPSYRPAASWPDQMQSTHWFNPSANLRSRTLSPETKDRSRRIRLCGLRSLGWTAAPLLSTLWKTTAGTGFDSRKASPTNVPVAGRAMAFRVPSWKITPLERKLSDLVEPGRDRRARNRRLAQL